MKKCVNPACDNQVEVYSGVDAFMLGVETEKWCYKCANAVAQATREKEAVNAS